MYTSTLLILSLGSLVRAASLLSGRASNGGGTSHQLDNRQQPGCTPMTSTFPPSDFASGGLLSLSSSPAPFVATSPEGSYEATGDGLVLYLEKPQGTVTKTDGGKTNSITGNGATVNSTFLLSSGKVTYEVAAPLVAGSVTAIILVADGHDEIDVELLGADPHHWQTNVYAPQPSDSKPLYDVLSGVEDMPSGASVDQVHNYTIDFNSERIIWSVDGKQIRTLKPSQTIVDGKQHYPTQALRLQMGIWDASTPEGTSEWAQGPMDWNSAPSSIKATIKSVTVECS